MGFNVCASGFFTALGNGAVSAALSFGRTLLFRSACVLLLPLALGLEGVWISRPIAEILALCSAYAALRALKGRYRYA